MNIRTSLTSRDIRAATVIAVIAGIGLIILVWPWAVSTLNGPSLAQSKEILADMCTASGESAASCQCHLETLEAELPQNELAQMFHILAEMSKSQTTAEKEQTATRLGLNSTEFQATQQTLDAALKAAQSQCAAR